MYQKIIRARMSIALTAATNGLQHASDSTLPCHAKRNYGTDSAMLAVPVGTTPRKLRRQTGSATFGSNIAVRSIELQLSNQMPIAIAKIETHIAKSKWNSLTMKTIPPNMNTTGGKHHSGLFVHTFRRALRLPLDDRPFDLHVQGFLQLPLLRLGGVVHGVAGVRVGVVLHARAERS